MEIEWSLLASRQMCEIRIPVYKQLTKVSHPYKIGLLQI